MNAMQDRIVIHRECFPAQLQKLSSSWGRWLVICDCEGAENEILDPAAVPSLRTAAILVETHDFVSAGVETRIRQRFAETHLIECIASKSRVLGDWPVEIPLRPAEIIQAMHEGREHVQSWLWLRPLCSGDTLE